MPSALSGFVEGVFLDSDNYYYFSCKSFYRGLLLTATGVVLPSALSGFVEGVFLDSDNYYYFSCKSFYRGLLLTATGVALPSALFTKIVSAVLCGTPLKAEVYYKISS